MLALASVVVVVDYIHAILQLLLLTFLLLLQQQPILILYWSILRRFSRPWVVMVLEMAVGWVVATI
jgi:hypothetical protein